MKPDELLRRLALNDERVVGATVGGAPPDVVGDGRSLGPRTRALVELAALLTLGAAAVHCRTTVDAARCAGASDEDIVAVLLAIGPAIGGARLVEAAPSLALAIDYEVEGLDERWEAR